MQPDKCRGKINDDIGILDIIYFESRPCIIFQNTIKHMSRMIENIFGKLNSRKMGRSFTNILNQSETLSHLLFYCKKTRSFWRDFEFYFYSLSKEFVHLTLEYVIVGIIITKCPLLNYLLLIAKIYLWGCRRTQILPNI